MKNQKTDIHLDISYIRSVQKSKTLRLLVLVTFILLQAIGLKLSSQTLSCGTGSFAFYPSATTPASANCGNSSSAYVNNYSKQSFYVPTLNDPLITVKLVFHIFNTSTAGYQSSGSTFNDLQATMSYITDSWERYSVRRNATFMPNFVPPFSGNKPGDPNLMDSRLKYEVVKVYFYTSATLYSTTDKADLFNHVNSIDPSRLDEGMPIFFNGAQFPGYSGHANEYNGTSFVHTSAGPGPISAYWAGQHLRHEIGHRLDLHHMYESELDLNPCGTDDFLSDVFPTTNTICTNSRPCGTCYEVKPTFVSNNVMCEDPIILDNLWSSPLQMGRRLRAMHLYNPTRKYAKEMTSQHIYPWNITSDETWDFDIQTYRDIVVKTGNILTIKCKVAMATDGKIIVEKGAKLILDGGEITGWCKKTPVGSLTNYPLWAGIEVAGDPNQNQTINNSTGLCANQGIVIVKNSSIISYAQKGIMTSITTTAGVWQNNTSGGIVSAENSSFTNNIFDIILYRYPNNSNACRVTNCVFKTNGLIGSYSSANTQIVPQEHIKLFQNRGLAIKGCTFECVPGTYNPANHGTGVYTTDSDFSIDQYGGRTKFNNLKAGVWVDNFNPVNSALINNSDFTNNQKGIIIENCDYLWATSNNLSISQGYTGIYVFKSKTFKIRNNSFTGNTRSGEIGTLVYGSGNGSHEIYRNSFSTLGAGIIAMDDNGGNGATATGTVTGLKMNCNDFKPLVNNTTDIALTKFVITPSVDPYQSPSFGWNNTNVVRNIYGAQYFNNNSKNKWYVDPSNTQIIFHASNSQAYTQPNNPNPQSSSQVTVIPTSIQLDYPNHCPASPASSGGGGENPDRTQRLATMNNYITELRVNNADNRNRFEIQSTVVSKLQLFLSDTLNSSMDSVVTILTNNQGGMGNADIQLVFAYIKKRDYSNALSKANALASNRTDWKELLKKIIEIEQDALSYDRIAMNVSDQSFLSNYANTEGKDGQTTAQALLKYALGTQHEFPVVYPEYPGIGERTRRLDNESDSELPTLTNENIKVFPNPAHTSLTIQYTGKHEGSLKVEIKDLLGRVIYTNFINEQNEKLISLNGLSNGVYLLSVYETDNKLIYQNKMIKQD